MQEREEPVALHLGALAANDGRREREIDLVGGHRLADLPALVLEDMAALAVVVLHDAAPGLDRRARAGGLHLERVGHVVFLHSQDGGLDGFDLRPREGELRHARLLLERLHLLAVEGARLTRLLLEPVGARVGQVEEAEVEEVDRLVAPLGQLDADRFGLLEARNRVAGIAPVVADDFLADEEVLFPGSHLPDVGFRVHDGSRLREVIEDERVALFPVGLRSPAARELGLCRPRHEVGHEIGDLVVL